jgi:aminoglycoside/choline kinase family phosphotransferase
MENILNEIRTLFQQKIGLPLQSISKIPQSGSNRIYFRIHSTSKSFIATYGNNIRENQTFVYFSQHFRSAGAPVPEILAINEYGNIYLQEDFGDVSLLNVLESDGPNAEVYALFQLSLKELARLQITGDNHLDYSKCITSREFGKQAIISDLLYFKYYFLDTLQIPYDKEKLLEDFEDLATYLSRVDHKYFMFRDFQSRNIMVRDGNVYFIDYQGGMKGALQYDVASMLWQARAELTSEWKTNLLEYYIDCVEEQLRQKVDRVRFTSQYNGYVLIRLLQVLGAYGFRGLFERKAQFLTSIPLALRNLRGFVSENSVGIVLPEFERLLALITADDIILRFEPIRATDDTPLVVYINSFSYKRNLPEDTSGNGGGFVFDCRGLLNPGRFEEYKAQTGRDKAVQDFLEQRTRIAEFLNSVYNIVDISVEDYIRRGFKSLQVSFGCTGGQHRSVYAADALARHLKNKFRVKTVVSHLEQESKKWINH